MLARLMSYFKIPFKSLAYQHTYCFRFFWGERWVKFLLVIKETKVEREIYSIDLKRKSN
jgi:hypothetical protein